MKKSWPFLLVMLLAAFGGQASAGEVGVETAKPPARASWAVKEAANRSGLCVLLNPKNPEAVLAWARSGRFIVHGLLDDAKRSAAMRQAIAAAGLAGVAAVERLPAGRLPYVDNLVNLIVAEEPLVGPGRSYPLREMLRALAPGGAACLALAPRQREPLQARLAKAGVKTFRFLPAPRSRLVFVKPRPAEMDDWPQPGHGADGNAVSHDRTLDPPNRLQWIAGPTRSYRRRNLGPLAARPGALLSAGGRNFYRHYIYLVARDAFNGALLWIRPFKGLNMRSGIVAGERSLYVYHEKKLQVLDAASGAVRRVLAEDVACRRLLRSGDRLIAVCGDGLRAFELPAGKERWRSPKKPGKLLAADGRLYYAAGRGRIVCQSLADGKNLWERGLPPEAGPKAGLRLAGADMLLLQSGTRFTMLKGQDGAVAWSAQSNTKNPLVFLAGGLLWLENRTREAAPGNPAIKSKSEIISLWKGHDPATGKITRTLTGPATLKYRCHPLYATDRFMVGNRPLYFMDWKSGAAFAFEGTRAQCGIAYRLGNGLLYGLYTTPRKCMCMATAMAGLTAFAAEPGTPDGGAALREEGRLVRGPAAPPNLPEQTGASEWPMYRGDYHRSSNTGGALPGALTKVWRRSLLGAAKPVSSPLRDDWRLSRPWGDPITQPTAAGGKIFVSLTHAGRLVALDAETGKTAWVFHAPARLDTPPTLWKGLCLLGCHDGWVYALRADNGGLVWRFRAAPDERRLVAYGQVESSWPVVGGVLIVKDTAFVLAGRTTETDGGLYIHALDPRTGKCLWTRRRYKPDMKPFGGYTPRRLQTYVGSADILCSEGKIISLSGSNRGRVECQSGRLVKSYRASIPFGWNRTRFRTDQYGTRAVPAVFLGKTTFAVDGRSHALRRYGLGGWKTTVPRSRIVEALALRSNSATLKQSPKRPAVRVPLVSAPPKVDGVIEEAYRRQSAPLSFSFLNGRRKRPRAATTAYLLCDARNLYIAFRCETPDPAHLVCNKTKHDDNVWQDEAVELFLDPANRRNEDYFHIIVNPAGVVQDMRKEDKSWNPKLEVACRREAKAWVAELRIPFKELGLSDKTARRVWAVNLNRTARDSKDARAFEDTAWSPTGEASSHVPGMFGSLWLDAAKDGRDEGAFRAWFAKQQPRGKNAAGEAPPAGPDLLFAALAARGGPLTTPGELWVLSASDGRRRARYPLPAAPARDGIALAAPRVFVSLRDGSVICWKSGAKRSSPPPVKSRPAETPK